MGLLGKDSLTITDITDVNPIRLDLTSSQPIYQTKRAGEKYEPDYTSSPLIITPWISYSSTDRAFFEELAQKNLKIKATVTSYFSAKSKTELLRTEEKTIKAELLDEINAQLVLGKITGIFFSEYIFLD